MPLLWEQSFCWKSPIALGYTRGHFSALVAMENDGYGNRGAGANLNTDDDVTITFLPLVDSERKLLHVHFLSAQEVRGGRSCEPPEIVLLPGPGPGPRRVLAATVAFSAQPAPLLCLAPALGLSCGHGPSDRDTSLSPSCSVGRGVHMQ